MVNFYKIGVNGALAQLGITPRSALIGGGLIGAGMGLQNLISKSSRVPTTAVVNYDPLNYRG